MKRILPVSFLFIFSLIIFNACSKSGTTDTPATPAIKPDTLTTGWSKITVPNATFADIYFANSTTGYALDAYCYKSVDGGLSWTKLLAPLGNSSNLAVTADGKIFVASSTQAIFRSIDGGANFTTSVFNFSGIMDMFFIDNNNGFTVGNSGLYKTTDGGVTWPIVTPVNGLSFPGSGYNTSCFINSTTGWIATSNIIYKTNGNINNWTLSTFTGTAPTYGAFSLFAVSSSLVFAGFSDGRIFKSVNGGTSFSSIVSLTPSAGGGFLDVHFLDANTGYANYGNRIYKTTDGGSSWLVVVSLGESVFSEIHFTDANHGWGCTNKGEVLRYFQ